MANANFVRGGHAIFKPLWCEKDYQEYHLTFDRPHIKDSAPYNAHVDGAYGSGLAYFTLGMPVNPKMMPWQRKMLDDKRPKVDDFIDLIAIPSDHYGKFLNFKIMDSDPRMAGATVTLSLRSAEYNADGDLVYTEITDFDDLLQKQDLDTPIPLDVPCNVFMSLLTVEDVVKPLTYSEPPIPPANETTPGTSPKTMVLGVKIASLPTDPTMTIADMRNAWYMSVKIEGFECPTHY